MDENFQEKKKIKIQLKPKTTPTLTANKNFTLTILDWHEYDRFLNYLLNLII